MPTIHIDRRALLRATALVPVALALADCAGQSPGQLGAAAIAALQALGQEFLVVEPELAAEGLNPKASVTVAGTTIALNGTTVTVAGNTVTADAVGGLIDGFTAALSAAATISEGQSTLIKVETYINALTPVIWPVVAPFITAAAPGAGFTIGLIVASLPAIEGLVNFDVALGQTLLTQQAQSLAALAPKPAGGALRAAATAGLTPDQALAELLLRAGR